MEKLIEKLIYMIRFIVILLLFQIVILFECEETVNIYYFYLNGKRLSVMLG